MITQLVSLAGMRNLVWRLLARWHAVTFLADVPDETISLDEEEAPEDADGGLELLGLRGVWLAAAGCALVLLCLLPICIILVLTAMGPAVGNVFSNIILELEATPY